MRALSLDIPIPRSASSSSRVYSIPKLEREHTKKKPRILIYDGFGTHETLEILEFCFENNILLCRIPSYTSHRLQPCDIGVFGLLKAAYRGRANTVGKEHFSSLYYPARDNALISRNIKAG